MGSSAPGPGSASGDRAATWWLFVAATAFFLLIANGITKSVDETSMREVARSLVGAQSISVPDVPYVGKHGVGGRTVSKYGIGQPLAAIPFEIAGRIVSAPLEDPNPTNEAFVTALVPFVMGALVAGSYVLARRLGGASADALGVAILASLGSINLVYGTEFFAEPLLGLFVLISVERAASQRWTASFAALAAATLVHPRGAPLVAVLVLIAWQEIGWRGVVRSAWPMALGVIALIGYDFARFGTLRETGYGDEGFTTPLLIGM